MRNASYWSARELNIEMKTNKRMEAVVRRLDKQNNGRVNAFMFLDCRYFAVVNGSKIVVNSQGF